MCIKVCCVDGKKEERTNVAREVFLNQDVTAITVLLLHVKKARHSPYLINHRAAALTR